MSISAQVETTKNASTVFTAIELAALAGRPDVYRFLAGLQNGLGGHVRGKKRPLWAAASSPRKVHPTHRFICAQVEYEVRAARECGL